MDDTKAAWVRSWLTKAHSDLRSARALNALSEPATDTAIYHCQQAAGKRRSRVISLSAISGWNLGALQN